MGVMDVPGTRAHMIFSFVAASTLARLMGLGAVWILVSGAAAITLDAVIDSGHEGCRRSAVTHSIASAPAPLLTALIIVWLAPLEGVALAASTLILLGMIMSASFLGHLLWDSLTINGIHVPWVGWVSLAHLESRGAAANAIPILFAILIALLFWPVPSWIGRLV